MLRLHVENLVAKLYKPLLRNHHKPSLRQSHGRLPQALVKASHGCLGDYTAVYIASRHGIPLVDTGTLQGIDTNILYIANEMIKKISLRY